MITCLFSAGTFIYIHCQCKGKLRAYKFHGATSSFNDQIGHVTNNISSEAKIEEHVENDKDHFDSVNSMEVTIANCGHGCDGPIDC